MRAHTEQYTLILCYIKANVSLITKRLNRVLFHINIWIWAEDLEEDLEGSLQVVMLLCIKKKMVQMSLNHIDYLGYE